MPEPVLRFVSARELQEIGHRIGGARGATVCLNAELLDDQLAAAHQQITAIRDILECGPQADLVAHARTIRDELRDVYRLDWVEAIVGDLDAKTEVFFAGLGTSGAARAYQCEVAPSTSQGSQAWKSYQGRTLRDAMDAAISSRD